MDGGSVDMLCISVLVFASMYGVHVLGLICMCNEDSTWICTVSWSYMHPHSPSCYTNKSKNSGLPALKGKNSSCRTCFSPG